MAWDGCTGENGGCGDGSEYADYVYAVWHTDQEREQNNENLQTAVDIGTTVLGIVNEPADWAMTITACVNGDCSPWMLLGILPIIPGTVGNKVDDVLSLLPNGVVNKADNISGPMPKPKGGVYTLTTPDGKVVRVGHTKSFGMREKSYKYDVNYFDLNFNPVYYTDNYAERRGLERYLYEKHLQPPLNINRPISPRNGQANTYIGAASSFLYNNFGIKWP